MIIDTVKNQYGIVLRKGNVYNRDMIFGSEME